MAAEPDYCFDPASWDATYPWSDRDEHEQGLDHGEIREVACLARLPSKWVVLVPLSFDQAGDPDETEPQWFDSKEAAEAARRAAFAARDEPA